MDLKKFVEFWSDCDLDKPPYRHAKDCNIPTKNIQPGVNSHDCCVQALKKNKGVWLHRELTFVPIASASPRKP